MWQIATSLSDNRWDVGKAIKEHRTLAKFLLQAVREETAISGAAGNSTPKKKKPNSPPYHHPPQLRLFLQPTRSEYLSVKLLLRDRICPMVRT